MFWEWCESRIWWQCLVRGWRGGFVWRGIWVDSMIGGVFLIHFVVWLVGLLSVVVVVAVCLFYFVYFLMIAFVLLLFRWKLEEVLML